ncbi:MgtC/SapB family protein [Trinickia dinghuensis]|uniref:Protein MgtC n=1 Tax=Trinickia dinghuensis TaxID=2291023 RepID=A0A3D8K8N7_9BURK|nr:MgtC/SapB family protein [Trinickia dinghuensis]RDV01002.1 MgtC/SapB family protein [Trinickia dinghuensis]
MLGNSELIMRLILAAILGSVIGFERERQSWAAGLRTHMLVCVSSALVMIVSAFGFADVLGRPNVVLDPSRIAAQVVSGIGFLGAGAILLRGEVIRGLTTAASVWAVAAIGLAVGAGLNTAAIAATVIILAILAGMKPIERHYISMRLRRRVTLRVEHGALMLDSLRSILGRSSERVKQFIVQQSEEEPEYDDVVIGFSRVSNDEFIKLCDLLRRASCVRDLREEIENGESGNGSEDARADGR